MNAHYLNKLVNFRRASTGERKEDVITNLEKAITQLNSQATASTTDQQIANLRSQITDLENKISAETDAGRKARLQNNLDSLRQQLASLDTSPASKLAILNAAKTTRDNARNAYENSRNFVRSKFNIPYSVTTTTTTKDDKGKETTTTTTKNYVHYAGDYMYYLLGDVMAPLWFGVYDITPLGLIYPDCQRRIKEVEIAQDSLNKATMTASKAQSSYDELKALSTDPNAVIKQEITVRKGADSILSATDAKGGLR